MRIASMFTMLTDFEAARWGGPHHLLEFCITLRQWTINDGTILHTNVFLK